MAENYFSSYGGKQVMAEVDSEGTNISEALASINGKIPESASSSNKMATQADIAKVVPGEGLYVGDRKIHPGTKLYVEGFPVDALDYELARVYNSMLYNRLTGIAASGTVTVGLWNYDTKTYVAEEELSTDPDNPTVINVAAADASDTMEIHLKGNGIVDSIMGSIV